MLRTAFGAYGITSQAVIQFRMDGTVLDANENFLKVMGYTLDEIKGKHHSMFVEPAYRASAEYKAFWESLNKGVYQAAQYKRIGKGGKEIWIQASYNPILDLNGKPYVKLPLVALETVPLANVFLRGWDNILLLFQ